jgi:hypothetical protein
MSHLTPSVQDLPESTPFSPEGLDEVEGPKLYRTKDGHLVNEKGERVDALGRVTRARGVKGKNSSRKWKW